MTVTDRKLKRTLDALYRAYHRDYIETDPLLFPRRYRRPDDREVVGFIAASLAYGRVDVMRRAIASVLARMGERPARFVGRFDPARDAARFGGFRYRLHPGRDVAALDLVRVETELGVGRMTSREETLLDLAGSWPRWPVGEAARLEMLRMLAAGVSRELLEELGSRPGRRAAFRRTQEFLRDLH